MTRKEPNPFVKQTCPIPSVPHQSTVIEEVEKKVQAQIVMKQIRYSCKADLKNLYMILII